jgi:flavin reductase (DIM6/NTAB) family NADH-FMN oxidoreductase RutF
MKEVDPQRQQLGAALGRVASGLFILTVRRAAAETGMLASWVQQCSLEPPQISMALKRDRPISAWLAVGSTIVINILDDDDTDMVAHFGRGFALEQPAFEEVDVQRADDGTPILSNALAFLQCRIEARYLAGDHELFVCLVLAGKMLNEGRPMVHVRKSGFHY